MPTARGLAARSPPPRRPAWPWLRRPQRPPTLTANRSQPETVELEAAQPLRRRAPRSSRTARSWTPTKRPSASAPSSSPRTTAFCSTASACRSTASATTTTSARSARPSTPAPWSGSSKSCKEMGCNAIRTSHNPPAPELLDLCDRMGFLVMDEAFDCWGSGKTQNDYHLLFPDWHEKDLRALVRRDRNHPCVDSLEHRQRDPRAGLACGPQGRRRAGGASCAAEDPTRPVTAGCNNTAAGYNGFQKQRGRLRLQLQARRVRQVPPGQPGPAAVRQRDRLLHQFARRVFLPRQRQTRARGTAEFPGEFLRPLRPALGDAAGHGVPRARTSSRSWPANSSGPASIISASRRPTTADTTNLLNFTDPAEKARMKKELKELGKIHVPSRSSYFGIIDLAGFKKDRFYLYQARWRPDLPMAHILPHWNWPDRVGQVTPGACLYLRRRGGAVPQRQIARPQEEGPVRVPPPLGRRGLSAGRTQGRRLQATARNGPRTW